MPNDGIIALKTKESLLATLGYRRVGLDLYEPPNQKCSLLGSLLYSPEDQTMATAGLVHSKNGSKLRDFQGFITRIDGARYVITSNVRGRLPDPDFVDSVSLPNCDVIQLREAHLIRLRNIKRSWVDLTDVEVKEQHLERLERNYSYFYDLGIYGPLEPV